ncbi:MAG: methyltransferase [Candidatus Uhrbacteria bacterium]
MEQIKLVKPAFMWLIVLLGVIPSLVFINWQKMFVGNVWNFVLFFLIIIYWLYVFISAWQVHCQAIRNAAEIDKIISIGIYARMRHPMYSGDIILAWGFFICFPYTAVLVGIMWLSFVLIFWAKLEEKALLKKFGNEYVKYQSQTPMFIPRFKK